MEAHELQEISHQSREDGERLYRVATSIYKVWIILIFIAGGIGILASVGIMLASMGSYSFHVEFIFMGLGMLIATAIFCALNYAAAVLSTHFAKVLVHQLFTNLALLELRSGGK